MSARPTTVQNHQNASRRKVTRLPFLTQSAGELRPLSIFYRHVGGSCQFSLSASKWQDFALCRARLKTTVGIVCLSHIFGGVCVDRTWLLNGLACIYSHKYWCPDCWYVSKKTTRSEKYEIHTHISTDITDMYESHIPISEQYPHATEWSLVQSVLVLDKTITLQRIYSSPLPHHSFSLPCFHFEGAAWL